MKSLSLVLLLALCMPGCMFSKSARMDRAYYKQLKQVRVAREKRREQLIQHQRAEMPSLRNSPPPLEMQTVQQMPAAAPEQP
ncbi:MAG TPA: hypothetical protein VLH83_09895 [Chthoniobacterales bacterium]|nr:hypothetical protein [Chthoniobacterales bacterium]